MVIYVTRDIRDVAVSWAKFIIEKQNRWAFGHDYLKNISINDRISFLLKGGVFDENLTKYNSLFEMDKRMGKI